MKDHITIEGHDGAFAAYIARPKALPAPAVIVLQEVFGVNADIRKHCDELAEQGFLAVAPDLFWRQELGVDLSVTSDADWQHGLRLYGAYDRDAGAKDVKDTVNAVRKLPESNGKVALLGYCLGGLMVFLTAVRCHGVDAAVAYHGGDTEKYLGEVDGLNAPVLMHLAEEDEFISKAAQAEIKAALALDLHHIVEVADGGQNDPSNLLALCPTCHALYTRGVISPESIRAWKITLVSLSEALDRSSVDDLLFLRNLQPRTLAISGDGVLKFSRLIAAGLAEFTLMMQNGPIILYEVHLSPKGIQLVDAWKSGDRKAFEAALGG